MSNKLKPITSIKQLRNLACNKTTVCYIDVHVGYHGKVQFKNNVKYISKTDEWEVGKPGELSKTYSHDGMRLDTSLWSAMKKGGLFLDA